MSRARPRLPWFPLWVLLFACLATLPALAEELLADRAEFAVGETVTLKIPDALGVLKPKWRASPAGIIQFTDKEPDGGHGQGHGAQGKAQVTATVDWKLGSTTYAISLNVTSGPSKPITPAIKDGGADPGRRPALDDPRMVRDRRAVEALRDGVGQYP
jgi:hypothetical protein